MAIFCVIIPYYQKQPGILARALQSVFAQSLQDFSVIVVDDASPLPIDGELEGLAAAQRERVTVIRQPNKGPGGARNTGLDAVPDGTRYVAFLDSDDEWASDHLSHAAHCMDRFGADCYWDSIQGGDAFYYHFAIADVARNTPATELSQDPLVIEVPDLAGEMLKNWSFMHLSCMVIGEKLFRAVRFEAALRLAAEDVLFFYDCVRQAGRVVLCDSAGAYRGEGMNIFHSIDNQSPLFIKQQFNTWTALDRLASRGTQNPEHLASIESYKQTARKQALWSQAGLVRNRRMPQWGLLARWAWRDPKLVGSAMALAAGKLSPKSSRI
ncbi:glycosyltransferase family 2 protein [Mesorhizobium xinjiangense]|uniref:glycosyltransferase family 2 protein n=1 Tax=Mesorhizobium xinjiangense TaxID=2678685 RepID=UPI0012EDFD87|nr:glycosyltransferase family 2 protein [Mesorhizobium xinjiangense]